jgi:hypothetical protein
MPLQNRVTPDGSIIAHPARGTMMGNRGGCLHSPDKVLGVRRWITPQWICCLLQFKGRHREVMSPDRYTELFFLDEATALAAGHRPCFECRREDAMEFARLWSIAAGSQHAARARAGDIDRTLHAERLEADGRKRTWLAALCNLPDGAMIRLADGTSCLVQSDRLLVWSASGYGGPRHRRSREHVEVLTPPGITAVMRLGYRPKLHETATNQR